MSASSLIPPRWRRPWRELRYRFYAGAVARSVNESFDMTDRALDAVEDRVAALEEIVAASWPRSMVLRRRLRREMRETVAGYEYMEPDFRRRRSEWMSEQVVLASLRASERYRGGKR